jgi:tetratricopeptide (TPR) repeat protein
MLSTATRAIAIDAGFALPHYSRAYALHALGQLAAARREATEAMALDPTWNAPCIELGGIEASAKDYRAALAAHERAVELSPLSGACFAFRASDLRNLHEVDRALVDAKRGVALAPESTMCWGELANCYFALGDQRSGLEACDQAVAAAPRAFNAYALRADFRKDAGDVTGAIADLEKARELDPGAFDKELQERLDALRARR